ncbi:hypothetical protein GCM10023191_037270 [Actinoallomurus oryzae]|uniref:DUF6286 domain-containing protein n=1 Tax=Actinoallomurus oryzae TaxID=502180 RepID=A0ABP8Q1W8_9ACTN
MRAFRPRRVLPASLAASLLTAAGASVAIHVISRRLGHPVLRPELTARLTRLTWDDPAVAAAGGGLTLAGLLFVLAAVLPGRTGTAPLAGDDPRFVMGLRRASLRADLHASVLGVPGVDAATVRLRGRLRPRAEIRAVTGFTDHGNLGEQVADAVRDRLEELDPVRVPEVAVRVSERKD